MENTNPINLRADQRVAAEKNSKCGEMFIFASKHVKCTRCGIVPKNASMFFYKSNSPLYSVQDGRICVCKECLGKIYNEYLEQTQDALLALQKVCCDLNYYYDEDIADKLLDAQDFSLGKYIQTVTMTRRGLTFSDNFSDLLEKQKLIADEPSTQTKRINKWNIEDKKNKDNVISKLGYDPFADNGYTDEQLKFLYNTTAGYLTDSVEQDPHKLQNVALLVKTFLQIDTIDKMINAQFNSMSPDVNLVSTLTATKEKLNTSAVRIANENGFSEKTSGRSSQGSNTLSARMQKMYDAKFELSKVNIHDVRMAEAYKEIAAINAHALINEMNLTGDDYARLCAEQRTFVSELQDKIEDVTEENRLLTIKLKDYEAQLKNKKK